MGYIQNLADRFWMTIGKTSKVYPVKVEKHRVKGDSIVFDSIDRGRTLINDKGRKEFDLMNEEQAEGLVKYKDFQDSVGDEEYVSLVMINRDKFVPLTKEYNLDLPDYAKPEGITADSDMNALEYSLSVSTFLEWADQHIEQSWKITETQNEKWWQQEKFQAAILFVAAGLFFIFVGYANSELYLKDMTQQMASLENALSNLDASTLSGGG